MKDSNARNFERKKNSTASEHNISTACVKVNIFLTLSFKKKKFEKKTFLALKYPEREQKKRTISQQFSIFFYARKTSRAFNQKTKIKL